MADADLLVTIGANVRRLRKGRDLTQAQLAARVGVCRSSVANIETGRQGDIKVTLLAGFADVLHADLPELLAGGGRA
ncbi:helix-turn-helix protein [Micromonospora pisi]|uniref:Helix-turn-helix protein n=1 Tax=Micromonospora pisi TaxID=589240 RepID=A0A495JV25_9ACTN|nr:helix-turn-helix domain-containing protein [Micromonospora pisi]RKR92853.1 helix-turn-helix protein [Micromonospora pisi]